MFIVLFMLAVSVLLCFCGEIIITLKSGETYIIPTKTKSIAEEFAKEMNNHK